MLRGMVFVDHMNFDIASKTYYREELEKPAPRLDYNLLFRNIVGLRRDITLVKTLVFAPHPDEFLMQDSNLCGYYKWVIGLNNAKYIDVIEGRYIARPTNPDVEMDINDHSTYYKVEKGTDINLAIHALSKGFYNSYDVAFIMSADSDYISLYRQLKSIGKVVVVVAVKGQNLGKIIPEVDDYIFLDENFFNQCLR